MKQIRKALGELKEKQSRKNRTNPADILNKYENGELTGEKAIAILEKANTSLCDGMKYIIKAMMRS